MFFNAPIGAALFALEIPHRKRLEYYEAIAPAIISFAIFRLNTGISIGGMYHFNIVPKLTSAELLQGLVLGGVGAFASSRQANLIFRRTSHRFGYLWRSFD